MAIAIDQANAGTNVDNSASGTIAVNTTQNIAANGFIVVAVGWWDTPTLSSVSGGSLTWNIVVQGKHPSAQPSAALAYAQAPSGLSSGTTITATFSSGSTTGRHIGVLSFTGVKTTSPVDTTAAANATGGAGWTTGSTTLAAGSVLVGTSDMGDTGSSSITSGIEALDWTDGVNTSHTTGYQIGTTAGSYTVAGTWSVGSVNMGLGAAFLEGVPIVAPSLFVVRSGLRVR